MRPSAHAVRALARQRVPIFVLAAALLVTPLLGQPAAEGVSPGVDVVYIADGRSFADALVGGVLAAMQNTAVLTVEGARSGDLIPQETKDELTRLQPKSIIILGGPVAVSDQVKAELEGYTTGTVTRLEGETRYGTAAAISQVIPDAIARALHADEADHATSADDADTVGGMSVGDLDERLGIAVRIAEDGKGNSLQDIDQADVLCVTTGVTPPNDALATIQISVSARSDASTTPDLLYIRALYSDDGGSTWNLVSGRASAQTLVDDSTEQANSYTDVMALTGAQTYRFAARIYGGVFDNVRCNLVTEVQTGIAYDENGVKLTPPS